MTKPADTPTWKAEISWAPLLDGDLQAVNDI